MTDNEQSEGYLDVSDIDPAELLAELYNRAQPMGMGFLQARPGDMTVEEARKLLDGETAETDYDGFHARNRAPGRSAYFDYLYGRPLKVKINGSTLMTRGYDRDYGEGAAAAAVEAIRQRHRNQGTDHG